jgi:hypothetical protein
MPIFLIKDLPIIASKTEFLRKYNNEEIKKSAFSFLKGYDFTESIGAMLKIWKEREVRDLEKEHYFAYEGKEAQEIIVELLVFFSHFYGVFKLLDSNDSIQPIKEYILPHVRFYFKEDQSIKLMIERTIHTVHIDKIRFIKGVINNFVVSTDSTSYYFLTYRSKRILIEPNKYNYNGDISVDVYSQSYHFNFHRPSRWKLLRFRKKGCLLIMN